MRIPLRASTLAVSTLLATLIVAGLSPPGGPAAPGAPYEPSRVAETDAPNSEHGLTLTSIPPRAIVGEPFPVAVSVQSTLPSDELEVAFRVGPRLTSRTTFLEAAGGETSGSVLQLITAAVVPTVDGAGLQASIAPDIEGSGRSSDARLVVRRDGVYPLVISLRESGTSDDLASVTTFVVRMEADAREPLRLSWIWPAYVEPPEEPGGNDAQLRDRLQATDALGAVADVARETSVPINLLVVPDTAVRLAALAAERPHSPDAAEAFDDIVAAGERHTLTASPYARVATDGWPVAAEEVDRQFQAAQAATDGIFGKPPDAGVQVAVGKTVPTAGLEILRGRGAAGIVFEPEAVEDPSGKLSLTRTFRIAGAGDLRGARADPDLRAALETGEGPVVAAQRLLADLTVLYLDAPAEIRGTVLLPDANWTPTADLLRTVLGRIASASYLRPVDLPSFFVEVPDESGARRRPLELSPTVPDARPPATQTAEYEQTKAARARLNALLAMVVAGGTFGNLDIRLLQSLDSGLIGNDRAARYSASVVDAVDGHLSAIRTPEGQSITLTSRSAKLPISIQNDSGLTVRVRLELDSSHVRFPEGSTRELVVPPRSLTTEIPVDTPSSGVFDIELRLTSADGQLLLNTATIEVRGTAVNGVAIALSMGSLAFLGMWWIVTVRRRRLAGKHARLHGHSPAAPNVVEHTIAPGGSSPTPVP